MLDILSPLTKVTRVSRSIYDQTTFVAVPGVWGRLRPDGTIDLVRTHHDPTNPKLIINSASANKYESEDIKVGRIATLESPGIRCKVDAVGFTGVIAQADDLVVCSDTGKEGKLIALPVVDGAYVVVARAEQINVSEGWIIFETVSPRTEVVGAGPTTTTAAPTTTTLAPTTTTVAP
jgi:hypothetical protein